MQSKLESRLSRFCDEVSDPVQSRKDALRLARSRSGRGLLERMAQREVINVMKKEVKNE